MPLWRASNEDFVRVLHGLRPSGVAWTRFPGNRLTRLFQGLADELVRVHTRIGADLLDEADPQTATDQLADWERVTGLPDCGYMGGNLPSRRALVVARLAARGGQRAAYYEAIAALYGVAATVSEGPWLFAWTMSMPTQVHRANCTDPCNVPLLTFGTLGGIVRCYVERYRPAHTMIFWTGT